MLNLNAFTGKEFQNVLALIAHFISKGITDVRTIQEVLEREYHKRHLKNRKSVPADRRIEFKRQKRELQKRMKETPPSASNVCPQCKALTWHENIYREGIVYNGCSSCHFSELVPGVVDVQPQDM